MCNNHVKIPSHIILRKHNDFSQAVWRSPANKENPEMFCKKDVLQNFAKFTGKHLCQSLYFNKVTVYACNFIKKETLAQVFSCKFSEMSKKKFSYRTPPVAASAFFRKVKANITFFPFMSNASFPLALASIVVKEAVKIENTTIPIKIQTRATQRAINDRGALSPYLKSKIQIKAIYPWSASHI